MVNSITNKTKKRCPRGYRVNKQNNKICNRKKTKSIPLIKNTEWDTFYKSVANTKYNYRPKPPITHKTQTKMSHFFTDINK